MKIISYKFLEKKDNVYFIELTVKRFLMKERKEIVFSKYPDEALWAWLDTGDWAYTFNDEMKVVKKTKEAIEMQQLFNKT